MFRKEMVADQLFLWYKGVLIYKRWLKTGQSILFDLHGLVYWSIDDN